MKTIYRRLMNERLRPVFSQWRGKVLDLASSTAPSYRKFFSNDCIITNADTKASEHVSHIDFDAKLPFADATFDYALCVNALYISKNPVFTLKEMRRVTRLGGKIITVTPFVFPEAPEPRDYVRWTSDGLKSIFTEAGFSEIEVLPFGGHFTSSLFIVEPFLFFRPLKYVAQQISILLDGLVPASYRASRPCPLGYVVVAKR